MRNGAEILLPQVSKRADFVAHPTPETETPQIIYYAGKSEKRGAFLRMIAQTQGKIVLPIDGGVENNTLDPVQIAAGKIDRVISELKSRGRISPDSQTQSVFIAADVQIHSPTLEPDGRTVSRTSGKPEEFYDGRQIFQGMVDSVMATGDKHNYGYMIEAGSECRTMLGAQTTRIEADTNFFYVALEQQAVDFFATVDGSRLYLDELNRFLRSSLYLSNGLKQPGRSTEICGGLDLAVLKKLGAVRKINQTPRESPDFDCELEAALLAAHVGFDISVLEQVNPNAQELIKRWPWGKGIMQYAQDRTTKSALII